MRLTIATPLAILLETGDVVHLRAEDETGSFGILAGHADFLTALSVSVVTWRGQRGAARMDPRLPAGVACWPASAHRAPPLRATHHAASHLAFPSRLPVGGPLMTRLIARGRPG